VDFVCHAPAWKQGLAMTPFDKLRTNAPRLARDEREGDRGPLTPLDFGESPSPARGEGFRA